ncbi:helix-turn-helix transcriptional regulator [Ascidiimonas aurantiaca]|uniref:helix-turn-helix transcriptional regulator n=1 Tax=Ascidiimonas aurantiaca TaxID=1685432 RepID=UPI0030EBEC1C
MTSFSKLTDQHILEELSRRVRQRRLNLNITQKQLAKSAGVHLQTIKKFEAGNNIQLLTLIQVLRVLGDLDTLNLFLPDPGISPVQLVKLKGKSRERASGESSIDKPNSSW